MTYYIKVFCLRGEVPTIGTLLEWAAEHDVDLSPPSGERPWTPDELAELPWDSVPFWYRQDWVPMLISVEHLDDPPSRRSLAESLEELRRRVGSTLVAAGSSTPAWRRDEVLAHLEPARFLVLLDIPMSGLAHEALWKAVWVLLDYFTRHNRSLAHIENAGFYRGRMLLLETDW